MKESASQALSPVRLLDPFSMAGPRLDRLPICGFHYRVLALIGAGLFVDALDLYLQGAVLAELIRLKVSNPAGNAAFISATFAALTIGSIASGFLADRYGRRPMYQINLLIFGLATVAAAAAPSFKMLLVFRFISGLGLGGEVITAYGTLIEFVSSEQRGRWQGRLAFISNLGLPVAAFLGWALIPRFGWRSQFALIGALALLVWTARRYVPESPRWYESRGRYREADAALNQIEAEVERRTGVKLEPAIPANASDPSSSPIPTLGSLFHGTLLRRTVLAMLLMICMNVTLYAFTAWLPTVLLQGGIALSTSLFMATLVQLGPLPGALLGSWAVDAFGRKISLTFCSILTAAVSATYAFLQGPVALVLVGFSLLALIYSLLAMTYGTYVPELFPTSLRLTGFGIGTAVGRLANVAAPFGIAALLTRFGSAGLYGAIAFVMIVQTAAVMLLGEETAGRSLEDIAKAQASSQG